MGFMDRAAIGKRVADGRRRDQSMELTLGASPCSQGSSSLRGRAGTWKVILPASYLLFQFVVFSFFPPLLQSYVPPSSTVGFCLQCV